MTVPTRPAGDRIVPFPGDNLVSAGSAQEFECRPQQLLEAGYRHVVADLRRVMGVDGAGHRAFARGQTTVQPVACPSQASVAYCPVTFSDLKPHMNRGGQSFPPGWIQRQEICPPGP
jgi:hypothetical protein